MPFAIIVIIVLISTILLLSLLPLHQTIKSSLTRISLFKRYSIHPIHLFKVKIHPTMSKRASSSLSSSSSSSDILSSPPSKSSKTDGTFQPTTFHSTRVMYMTSNKSLASGRCVVYWMTRDQRVNDNYSLLCAQELSQKQGVPIKVVFNLVPKFLQATLRQYSFMITGLQEVEQTLKSKNVPFHLTFGDPKISIPSFAHEVGAITVITDFSPLRVNRGWVTAVADLFDQRTPKIPLLQVDSHNIVPCWIASPKLEYGARTIRSKIQKLLPDYLVEFPSFLGNFNSGTSSNSSTSISANAMTDYHPIDWKAAFDSLEIDRTITAVDWIQPGETAAMEALVRFGTNRLKDYGDKRNDPNLNVQSDLSPYFHFGQLSVQRAVLYTKGLKKHASSTDSFVEEAVVRRELADNFCYYNPRYDSLEGCYDWAKETLRIHAADTRPILYTREELEHAKTHDDLWNAAQIQMTRDGKMHGFLRMYWAKKILEWTPSPEEALSISIYLNDRYELDGRDPNGYVGCMWSIGGVHDQGWGERSIFGKIRYMNYKGCQRKFDVKQFVAKYPPAYENSRQANLAGIGAIAYNNSASSSANTNHDDDDD